MAAAVGTVRVARGDQGGGDGGGGGGSSNGGGGGAQGPREADGPGEGLGARGRIVLLLFWSTFAMYLVRVNLSDSILQMEDEFHWSHTQKGVVLASFFFGYIVGQLPGGALAVRFGGKRVLLFAVGWAGVCAALTPLSAGNLPALVAVRVVMGVGESVAYPAILQLLSAWSPLPERSLQCNVAYSGATLGVIFSLFVTPFTMGRGLGWQCSFYLYGAHALLWCVAWAALAAATPEEQPGISQAEVAYIRKNFSTNWLMYVAISWLPEYFEDRWHVDVRRDVLATAYLSALPFAVALVFSSLAALVCDALVRGGASQWRVRRACQLLAMWGAGAFMLLTAFVAHSRGGAVGLLTAALSFSSLSTSGYVPTLIDIAGAYSGLLLGVSNTFGTVPGIVGVAATGAILDASHHDWHLVFSLAAAVALASGAAWLALATGERVHFPRDEAAAKLTAPVADDSADDTAAAAASASSAAAAAAAPHSPALAARPLLVP